MCNDCYPQQNRFHTLYCIYDHLVEVLGYEQKMYLKDYSRCSRDLRSMAGIVLAVFRGTGEVSSSYWQLRTPIDDLTDEIPSGYEAEDILIESDADIMDVIGRGRQ